MNLIKGALEGVAIFGGFLAVAHVVTGWLNRLTPSEREQQATRLVRPFAEFLAADILGEGEPEAIAALADLNQDDLSRLRRVCVDIHWHVQMEDRRRTEKEEQKS